MKRNSIVAALALLAAPAVAIAQPAPEPIQIRLQWVGNDLTGGVLINRVRGLIAASPDKRETFADRDSLSVIVQTIDPAIEWQDKVAAQKRLTVYSLTISQHHAETRTDTFASAALGYCALADVAICAREIIEAMDEQIVRRELR